MRLFATKVDPTKGAEAATAFTEYEAVESDPAKKAKAEKDYAELLFQTSNDAAGYEKAIAEFQKILEKNPDDSDALLRVGQALFNIGAFNNNDKAKYQEASNYLQRYVDKAPEGQLKSEAKDLIATMKQQANATPEKTTRAGSPPACSTRYNSPPDTMSNPAPARASSPRIASVELAFTA
jgi:tetratricopeptide (TPR) repeat protein